MTKFKSIRHWLWTLLFFCQVFLGGYLFLFVLIEPDSNNLLVSQATNVVSPLQALKRNEVFLDKTQEENVLQYCSSLEQMLAAHVQFEQAVIKGIKDVIAIVIFFLIFSMSIQMAIILVGRQEKKQVSKEPENPG